MALMVYLGDNGDTKGVAFKKELRMGADAGRNQLVLPAEQGVDAEHAIVMRAAVGGLPVLIDLAGHDLKVNGQRVISLRVLHHGDTIQIGDAGLMLRELQIIKLPANSRWAGKECASCTLNLEPEMEVVACPLCEVPHHRECWFELTVCSTYACQYPIHETVMRALSPPINFERNLGKESKLLKESQLCVAGKKIDLVPFQRGQNVARCPSCNTPFHLNCWLSLKVCPQCSYGVKALISQVFASEHELPQSAAKS
jgi:Zn finger protein HypA/HybF involved in hydrogenase expression